MPKPPSKALTLAARTVDLEHLESIQICTQVQISEVEVFSRADQMLAAIDGLQYEHATKSILLGLYLHQIKARVGHGAFGKYLKRKGGLGARRAGYCLALSKVFAKSSKLLLPELLASDQLALTLDADSSELKTVKGKLEKFVGKLSYSELLEKHGIKTPKADKYANVKVVDLSLPEHRDHKLRLMREKALSAFAALHEISDEWKLLTEKQIALAVDNSKAFAKKAEQWLATPAEKRASFDVAEQLGLHRSALTPMLVKA